MSTFLDFQTQTDERRVVIILGDTVTADRLKLAPEATTSNSRPLQHHSISLMGSSLLYHSLYHSERPLVTAVSICITPGFATVSHRYKTPASVNCLSSVVASLLAEWDRMNVDNDFISMVWRSSFEIFTTQDV